MLPLIRMEIRTLPSRVFRLQSWWVLAGISALGFRSTNTKVNHQQPGVTIHD